MMLPKVYIDHQFTQLAAEEMSEETRWWLHSDNYGGQDSSYDLIMSNLVKASTRVSFITGGFPNSHPDLILWAETDTWHVWD